MLRSTLRSTFMPMEGLVFACDVRISITAYISVVATSWQVNPFVLGCTKSSVDHEVLTALVFVVINTTMLTTLEKN